MHADTRETAPWASLSQLGILLPQRLLCCFDRRQRFDTPARHTIGHIGQRRLDGRIVPTEHHLGLRLGCFGQEPSLRGQGRFGWNAGEARKFVGGAAHFINPDVVAHTLGDGGSHGLHPIPLATKAGQDGAEVVLLLG